MCPANGELENQDPEAPVEFLCQVAHLRAYTFGFPVPAHGPCECCPGGQTHGELSRWAAQLKGAVPGAGLRRSPALAVMRSGAAAAEACGGGGCTSCRSP
jgi:hypothetical protein